MPGDAVATLCQLISVPVVYVVGTDGKILDIQEGFKPDLDESLARTISSAPAGR